MRLLVTGGCGFIGSNFLHYIVNNALADVIVNVDCLTYAANVSNLPKNTNIINYSLNITDDIAMYNIMYNNKITHVVHFAAESHVDNSISGPREFIETNINGTFSLLEAARKHKGLVRFHHVSTDEVYGSLGSTGKFLETTPYDPRSPYSASKASSDHLVRAYNHTYGLNTTISNCSNNYGPRQHQEKLIPKAITNILAGKKVPVYGAGNNIRDWLYVDDHCEAIWKIVTNGAPGSTYNVGGDCEKSNVSLLQELCILLNVKFDDVVEYVEDRKGHDFRYAIDHTKITNDLNWSPSTHLQQGLQKTIDFYIRCVKKAD